ncbi:hypothetical protein JCM33774_87830 [Actinophytocola sp. KF-1]
MVAGLRDSLDRCRPVATPGAPGRRGVPADRVAERESELAPLFATLTDTEQAAGWQPRAGAEAVRQLAGWFEIANAVEHARARPRHRHHLRGPCRAHEPVRQPARLARRPQGRSAPSRWRARSWQTHRRRGQDPAEELRRELLAFDHRALCAVAPKEIVFDQSLPHTRSGTVMWRLLKAREPGPPQCDLSTLESVR